MDYDVIIFWLVCFSVLSPLVVTLARFRSAGRGWIVLYALILLVCLLGRFAGRPFLIYIAFAVWLIFVLLPGLLMRLYLRMFLQQRYRAARRLARINSCLHPADGWREQPEIVRALEMAQQGELAQATEILERYQGAKLLVGIAPVLYRITDQWEEMIAWEAEHRAELARMPQFLQASLRARGETGDRAGLIELYARHQNQIARLSPATSRDLCRLMLFAFCGRRDLTEGLFRGSLSILPESTKQFWLATADLAAGRSDAAKQQFEQLLPLAEPLMRRAVERRLARITVAPEPLSSSAADILESAALEHGHDEKFGASPSLFSRRARVTQILIGLNLAMFAMEIFYGGATEPGALYRLGALIPESVRAGQWWRLLASCFLHFGGLHLAMNMIALWVLAPFAELSLGARRFLAVYLLAGVGSMGVVMAFASGPNGEQMTVGASGSIMGLIGATGALMLRGWVRDRALSARRRLIATLIIVTLQTVFDALVPQVSMSAHLSGAVIGFAATILLRDRLQAGRKG